MTADILQTGIQNMGRIIRLFLAVLILTAISDVIAETQGQAKISSSEIAMTFQDIAHQLYSSPKATQQDAEQAMVMLGAAMELQENYSEILPDIIELGWAFPDKDYTPQIYFALNNYLTSDADLDIASKAVQYLLERKQSREDREKLLVELLAAAGQKNKQFSSDLHAQLGFLAAERADVNTALSHFLAAYNDSSNYNRLAFEKIQEIISGGGYDALQPVYILSHYRAAMTANPLNIEAAFAFAHYAEYLELYDIAAQAYGYASELFAYNNPFDRLPASIYLPWILSCYNSVEQTGRCQTIAQAVRKSGKFDIMVEAVDAASAQRAGDMMRANSIYATIAEQAEQALQSQHNDAEYQKFAWYYSFVNTDSEKALTFATKAYDLEPNSPSASALFAYALAISGQKELALPLAQSLAQNNQIAAIALAKIESDRGNSTAAIDLLKSAIAMDAGTFEAAKARRMLSELGSMTVPPVEADAAIKFLEEQFGLPIVPQFMPIKEIISVKIAAGGSDFTYGNELNTKLVIVNKSAQPLVISQWGLFKGNIRIDVSVSGDISANLPKVIERRIYPSSPIKAGNAAYVDLPLYRGALRQLLDSHPQAAVELEISAWLDPVDQGLGGTSALALPASKIKLHRRKLAMNTLYLQQRLDTLSKGKPGQKIAAVELFTALLLEQESMAATGPIYRFMAAEPALLKSAIVRALEDRDMTVKVKTLSVMRPLKLDYQLISAASRQLADERWPVRLMALFLLGKAEKQDFQAVLDWTARFDQNPTIRQMALALGAVQPSEPNQPAITEPNQPAITDPNQAMLPGASANITDEKTDTPSVQ